MDFLDPKKKRAHTRRLFIGYGLIAIAIALASLVLLFTSYGYDLDRKTGQVIQNGLVFVNANPEQATVYLNGKNVAKTDARLTLPAATYDVELRREGYRTWKKTIKLEGSSIEQLVYPVLFPTTLTPKDVKAYDAAPAFATQSPDRRWVLVQKQGDVNTFDLFDTNDPKKAPTIVSLPAGVVSSGKNHTFSAEEWSTDNRHVLLKHTFGDSVEFIVLDRETPAQSLNLTKQLGIAFTSISLRDKKYDQYYLYDKATETLKSVSLKDKTVKSTLERVIAYKSHGSDMLLYAQKDKAVSGITTVMVRNNSTDYVLRTNAKPTDYLLDLAQYENHWYVAVGEKSLSQIVVYKDPLDTLKAGSKAAVPALTTMKLENSSTLNFSQNTRFIAAQNGSKFAVYDIDTSRRHYFDVEQSLARPASWMDGHRLAYISSGKLYVVDFDGINKQELVAVNEAFMPFFDRNYDRLFTLGASAQDAKKASLSVVDLQLNL